MKPTVHAGNLIACQPCAKAKAKCDKQLPACSRCLYKRLVCEQRPSRRYAENPHPLRNHVDGLHPQPSASASPRSHDHILNETDSNANDASVPKPAALYNATPETLSTMNNFPWPPEPFHDADQDAAGFSSSLIHPRLEQLDTAMNYDFALSQFEPGPPVTLDALSNETLLSGTFSSLGPSSRPPQYVSRGSSTSSLVDEKLPCFQCNPKRDQPIDPRIGSEYLQKLEETLHSQSAWSGLEFPDQPRHPTPLFVTPVQDSLRDKLMVISQGFLSRARDVHHNAKGNDSLDLSKSASNARATGFFILPPTRVLDDSLRTYACRVEPYMPFFSASKLDSAELMVAKDEKPSSLLLLLMIALGAMGKPQHEARCFASGLVEICRISIFDIMEKNVKMAAQPAMLQCALLYLNAAAWSGYKWHMDLSAAHSRLYILMVQHAGLMDSRSSPLAEISANMDLEAAWITWKSKESLNRLAYSWIIFDQEIGLFHDRQSDFEIDNCNAPVPCDEELWNAPSSYHWQTILQERCRLNPLAVDSCRSLAQLFNMFMSDELSNSAESLSQIELRLLLQPLQALIYHLNKSLHYFFISRSQRLLQRLLTQLEEVQYLLRQWYSIASRSTCVESPSLNECSNMIIFHLISLNASTYLPDIERLASGDTELDTYHSSWTGKRCAEEGALIWCHCGQVIRYFRKMPSSSRPLWWSAAMYRAALCLWAVSLSLDNKTTEATFITAEVDMVAVDKLPCNHPSLLHYLRHHEGNPALSRADGTLVRLGSSTDIVQHCIEVLKEKIPQTQLDTIVQSRLSTLVARWMTP